MRKPYIQRHTRLHPKLWAPYKIIAYPYGFHNWPGDLALPVWIPEARVVGPTCALLRTLGEQRTLDDAIEACWIHLAGLMSGEAATSKPA
ncbi:hypothetical protein [Sphingomonas sanxanigenens]|uniref:Uncharacterized protein n=1 Tax=Sphingomonas sanxanigenens DSM 19645 = NX02 TaxID=1123269 RepID=A0A0F7JRA3_9SPHN|nr:hypothetical protein [Sphingomonas sanxanigenens]AKH18971.1 hypothetical protein NX02_p1650 [Sphingomonas sanxanigenens DSM 19645 = NX02]